jgi:hypothetical protein
MPLVLDLPDQTFADPKLDSFNSFATRTPCTFDALDDWAKQRLPVFRLRSACNNETSVHRRDLRLACHKDAGWLVETRTEFSVITTRQKRIRN